MFTSTNASAFLSISVSDNNHISIYFNKTYQRVTTKRHTTLITAVGAITVSGTSTSVINAPTRWYTFELVWITVSECMIWRRVTITARFCNLTTIHT